MAEGERDGVLKRWTLHGDLPWRAIRLGVRLVPGWLERPIIAAAALAVLLGSGRVRRALLANHRVLRPDDSVMERTRRLWRTLYHFGSMCTDSVRTSMGAQILRWEVTGTEHFDVVTAAGGPVILCTAHMGCYDAAAAAFAGKMGSRLSAVRLPERTEAMRRLRDAELRTLEQDKLRTVYNSAETMLGVELLKALKEGEWVAIQADRALPGLSVMSARHDGLQWQLPRGPFMLAMMSRAACLPVLTTRTGHRRYRVQIFPAFHAPETRDREAAAAEAARAWLDVLGPVLRECPEQWLVFEPLVAPAS